jgi:hypothetical protein
MDEESAIDNKKKIQDNVDSRVSELGDVKSFAMSLVWGVPALLVVAYVGSTVVGITQLSGQEIDDLFPTDLEDFPYQIPPGKSNPKSSIAELFTKFGTDSPENLTRATLEFVFPMKSTSFPYKSWFLSKEFDGSKGFVIAKWFAMTCANTFCFWRSLYKILIVLGKWFYSVLHNYADLFLFYVYSYFVIYIIMLPIIPVVGFCIAVLGSTMYNIPGSWVLTFAPAMGILLAIGNLFSGGILNVYSWVISMIMVGLGYAAGYVNAAWWALIGCALWLYTVVFLFIAPILHKGGMQNMVKTFKEHKKSLLAITLLIIVKCAFASLSKALSIGITLGALICAYLIYKMESGKPGAVPVATAI